MEDLLSHILQLDPIWAYLLLFLSAYIENIFPPIPGDTVTIFGAYLVATGKLNFTLVCLSTTVGSISGFMTIFGFAYWLEREVIEKYQPRWVSQSHLDKVESWFRKRGYWVILFNRFLSGARSVISLVAGLSKMRVGLVFLLSLISCTVWNVSLIYLGAGVGRNWKRILAALKTYNRLVLGILVIALLAYLIYYLIRKHRIRSKASDIKN